jgi:hypothetical protein
MSTKRMDDLLSEATEGMSRSDPHIGPSDSSDSANDLPESMQDTDSDRQSTGERPAVENRPNIASGEDVDIDKEVSSDDAGLAHTPPDPARNGGLPDEE